MNELCEYRIVLSTGASYNGLILSMPEVHTIQDVGDAMSVALGGKEADFNYRYPYGPYERYTGLYGYSIIIKKIS